MNKHTPILLNLQNPREKIWGILISIQTSGITVAGIDLNSFDDWVRSAAAGDSEMGLSTLFLPMHRVERVTEDETIGSVRSYASQFEERVGVDVWTHLGFKRELPPSEASAPNQSSWMSLADAARDYVERVVEDCGSDMAAAAEVLGITVEELEAKLNPY